MNMRRLGLTALALAVLVMVYLGVKGYGAQTPLKGWDGYERANYSLYGRSYSVLVADTPAKQSRGLMNVKKLDEVDGMLFRFPVAETQYFWNENTYLDLDIYWLKDGTVIGKSFLPSIEKKGQIIVNSPSPVDEVVEIVRQ